MSYRGDYIIFDTDNAEAWVESMRFKLFLYSIIFLSVSCTGSRENKLFGEIKLQKNLPDTLDNEVSNDEGYTYEAFFRAATGLKRAFDEVYFSTKKELEISWMYLVDQSIEIPAGSSLVLILGESEVKLSGHKGILKLKTSLKDGLNQIEAGLYLKDAQGQKKDLGIKFTESILCATRPYLDRIKSEFRKNERAGTLANYMTVGGSYAPSESDVMIEKCLAIYRKEKSYRTSRRTLCMCATERAVKKGHIKEGEVYKIDESSFATKILASVGACSL